MTNNVNIGRFYFPCTKNIFSIFPHEGSGGDVFFARAAAAVTGSWKMRYGVG
jgi:hypothetical protein